MTDQLSSAIRPTHYDIKWNINFETFTFTGEVITEITISETVPHIRLHCEGLSVTSCSVKRNGEVAAVTFSRSNEDLLITAENGFSSGTVTTTICFSGKLDDSLSGLYRSKYSTSSDTISWLATTQFEAPYARKALPCFDEPQFKATFSVSLDIPAEMTGISNMPVASEKSSDGRKTITFATTPLMSTYLLYIGAGTFDHIEETRNNRTLRVYGVNGKSTQGAFALSFAADVLAYFEEYTSVPYPLPKLDLIAIPDFAAGAMENWGAITFREALLFCDEKNTSFARKKRIADIISHELWHQWSGNLVTMQWWDDLWLNEAFATFIAYKAVDHFYPDWHIWDTFTGGRTNSAFEMDMLTSTHPIAVPVETPNQIEEIFDSISYGKGASVLRMIEAYIGEEPFRNGVSAYLSAFAYKNATASDLWDILETHSGKPVKEILAAWVAKPGFPLITVTPSGDTHVVQQERFGTDAASDDLWPIPLTWSENGIENSVVLQDKNASIPSAGHLCKFNIRQTGFYRVLYRGDLYNRYKPIIHTRGLTPHDRWGMLNDLWSSVFSGYAEFATLMEFMSFYRNENSRFVLDELRQICASSALLLRLPDNGTSLYQKFTTPFLSQFDRLGWDSSASESAEDRQLRPLALSFLISATEETLCREAFDRAQAWLSGENLNPDLRTTCLHALTRTNDPSHFAAIKTAYETSSGPEEKLSLLGALADFHTQELLTTFLDYSLGDSVRLQDLRTVFSAASGNPACGDIFFPWVKARWTRLSGFSSSYFIFAGLLQTLITTAPDRKTLDDINSFLNENTNGFEKTKANSFEKAELIMSFRERVGSDFHHQYHTE